MELNLEPVTTPVRPAATVVMLRDGDAGLEVFLLKRHGLADVLGGAFVFPGGKVDAADAELDMLRHLDTAAEGLPARLNEAGIDALTAAGLHVAAIREAFEESGVLFAEGASAEVIRHANALMREGRSFASVLAQLELRLGASRLLPWSRWITPVMPSVMNKRFDTRFFVAAAPEGQIAAHNDHESTEGVWIAPRAALERYWRREIDLAPPQIMSLAHLARHDDVAGVLDAARLRPPPVIQPEPFDENGLRTICYPGDERHTVRERALPGPTRLTYRDRRFEPAGGLEALFL